MVDLTDYFKLSIKDTLKEGEIRAPLGDLPSGVITLVGTSFDSRGLVPLGPQILGPEEQREFRAEVPGIPVGRTCQRIHFLHTTRGASLYAPIGHYIIHFADESEEKIELIYGVNITRYYAWAYS